MALRDVDVEKALFLGEMVKTEKAKAGLTARLTTKVNGRSSRKKHGNLSPYWEIVNYLILTYGTDEVIAEDHAQSTPYRQPDRMKPPDYSNDLWNDG